MINFGSDKFFIQGFSAGYGKTIITAVLIQLRQTTQTNKFNEQNKEIFMVRINLNAHRNTIRIQQTQSNTTSANYYSTLHFQQVL